MLILDDNCAIDMEDIRCVNIEDNDKRMIYITYSDGKTILIRNIDKRLLDIMQYIRAWNTKKNHLA